MKARKIIFEKESNIITFDEVEKLIDENNDVVLMVANRSNGEIVATVIYKQHEKMWHSYVHATDDGYQFSHLDELYKEVDGWGNYLHLPNTIDEVVPHIWWDDIPKGDFVIDESHIISQKVDDVWLKGAYDGHYWKPRKENLSKLNLYHIGKIELL